MVERDWYKCHGQGWTGIITPKSFSHPAKFSRALIRRIYDHLFEQGYLHEDDTIIDPFGGICLGALHAMQHGCHWIGCELEDRFVQLGQQNIDLWNERYAPHFPRWGTAIIVQGDSRELAQMVGQVAGASVSSPPYADQEIAAGSSGRFGNHTDRGDLLKQIDYDKNYSHNSANLGNMPKGDHAAALRQVAGAVSSPPYTVGVINTSDVSESDRQHRIKIGRNPNSPGSHGIRKSYGRTAGQLGAMPTGDLQAAVSSPPYTASLASDDPDKRGGLFRDPKRRGDKMLTAEYGESEGQLGAMKEGNYQAAVSSPPYAGIGMQEGSPTIDTPPRPGDVRQYSRKAPIREYGESEGQLGAMPAGDHAAQVQGSVSSPPYEKSMDSGDENASRRAERPRGFSQGMPTFCYGENPYTFLSKDPSGLNNQERHELAARNPQVGALQGDTFWSAARLIVEQTYQVLAPGAVAVWVCKSFVRKKKRVDFPNQWRELCESVGLETVEWIRAWLVEDRGAQFTLFDGLDERKIERKSFFRRLHEFSARAKKFWNESVSRDDKALHLWLSHNALWENYRISEQEAAETGEEIEAPYPTKGRILHNAQKIAYVIAGEPDLETGVEIDYEVVIIQRKPGG